MTDSTIHSYKELIVWQRGVELVKAVYELTAQFPQEEQYGLTAQMRRAAVSIPSNIAEGRSRGTRRDYAQFLRTAFASSAELETQIIISKQLHMADQQSYQQVESLLDEVMRTLAVMIRKMNPTQTTPKA